MRWLHGSLLFFVRLLGKTVADSGRHMQRMMSACGRQTTQQARTVVFTIGFVFKMGGACPLADHSAKSDSVWFLIVAAACTMYPCTHTHTHQSLVSLISNPLLVLNLTQRAWSKTAVP